MSEKPQTSEPQLAVEELTELSEADLNDLCDSTDAAIEDGGGFGGWVNLPAREILASYWKGVMIVPERHLFVARLDGVICGTVQMIRPPKTAEAQAFTCQLTTIFVAPWARSYGLAQKLIALAEKTAIELGHSVINLDVRETQSAAISLYEKLGYQLWGTHPYYAQVRGKIYKGLYFYKVINREGLAIDSEEEGDA